MTDHDLPRAFCLVKVGKNAFFSAESGVIQAVGLHFVMCESQTFGRGFLMCWRVRNVYLKYMYMIVRGGRRWALVRCIGVMMMMILG